MGEIKKLVAYTLNFWAMLLGFLVGVAVLGLPLWALLYFIYWVL